MSQQLISRSAFARLSAAVIGTALLGAGCAPPRQQVSAVGEAGDGQLGRLTWGWRLPTTWDSAKGIGYDVHVLSLVYSGLTRLGPDGALQPDLAESWTYNGTGDAVTFHLRPNLTYSDGTPVDAAAVKAGLERSRDLPGATSGQSLAIIQDITADSATDVTLHLAEVSYQLPLLLAGLIGHLVSPAAIESGAELNIAPVGAGPFVLAEYVPGSHATLRRNPNHWNAAEILLDELQVVPRPAEAVAYAGLRSGQYDLAHVDDSQILPLEQSGFSVIGGTCFNVHTIEVNNRHAPFDDPRVVEAFNRAIDREGIIEGPLFGHGEPDWQPFSRGVQGYDPELHRRWDHDPEEAHRLLAEAGHPDGISVTFHVIGDAGNDTSRKIAEAVQAQVTEAGFDLRLEIAPPGAGQKAAHSYTLYMYSFSGRESPVQALEVLYSEGGWMNISQQAPEEFTTALERVRRTPLESPDYLPHLQAATRAAVSGASPHAWLVNWNRAHALNDRVTGFTHCIHTQRFEGVGVRS
ncbi:peptide/nickel transport system substrate-binding protein [Brevibacterium pityocampae]